MRLLCELTQWKEEAAQRGRAVGNIIRSRYVIAADNWNWLIGVQRGNDKTVPVGESFVGSMNMLFSWLDKNAANYQVDAAEVKQRIITSLENLTGKKAPKPKMTGAEVDDFFQTSQMKKYPPTVIKDVFKAEDKDE